MRAAWHLAHRTLRDYSSKFSRHDFTLPQLFACLAVKEHQKKSYRQIEALLRGNPRVAPDLEHAHLEDRLIAIGRTDQGRPLFVAFTIRERSGQRLIRPVYAREGDRTV